MTVSEHDTVVIGAGQAGLAASHELRRAGVEHIVLERGRIADAWRHRWDSLRLLTPNWMTRLPGHQYAGPDPEGFMSRAEIIALLETYAMDLPIVTGLEVRRVTRAGDRFELSTGNGLIRARHVVVATGGAALPRLPRQLTSQLDRSVEQIHSAQYRNPDALPPGGVMVVGAGASALQIADELSRSGRRTSIAIGRHARAPRAYRGMDIWWWLDRLGSLDVTVDEVGDLLAARRAPSLGLTGAHGGVDLDLGTIRARGVEILGRVTGVAGRRVFHQPDVLTEVAAAETRLERLLSNIDRHAHRAGLDPELPPPHRPVRLRPRPGRAEVDLVADGITSVVWCTGYTQDFSWLPGATLDATGELRQRRGVTSVPGLYVLGLRFQWTRGSHFIDRVGGDARFVVDHIMRRRGTGHTENREARSRPSPASSSRSS